MKKEEIVLFSSFLAFSFQYVLLQNLIESQSEKKNYSFQESSPLAKNRP